MRQHVRRSALFVALALTAVAAGDPPPLPTFADPYQAGIGTSLVGAVLADFDGDTDVDVATADATTLNVNVMRNSGVAQFPTTNSFALASAPTDIVVADWNGDTKPDLAFATANGIVVSTNQGLDGSNALTFVHASPTKTTGASYTRLAAADYDGDGRPDIVAVGPFSDALVTGTGIVSVWLNDGNGAFPNASTDLVYDGEVPDTVAMGDFSGDGKAEICVGTSAQRYLHVFFNPASGSVDLGVVNDHLIDSQVKLSDIEIVDATSDGRPDVVMVGSGDYVAGQNRASIVILPVKVNPAYRAWYDTALGYDLDPVLAADAGVVRNGIAVADVNGDATPELVVTNNLLGKFAVVVLGTVSRDPAGNVQDVPPANAGAFDSGATPFAIAVGKLNGDAANDVLTVNAAAGLLQISLSVAGGGGGNGTPATNLKMASKRFPGNTYQDGQTFTFTVTQPDKRPGTHVRIQHTTTPGDEGSWEDMPVTPFFLPAKKKNDPTWTNKSKHVPPGDRYFRTVTTHEGEPDGINKDTTGPAAYIGPFTVAGRGPVVVTTAYITSGSDNVNGTTHVGDTVYGLVRVVNSGSSEATKLVVTAKIPTQTTYLTSTPNATSVSKTGKLTWEVPALPVGGKLNFVFTAIVNEGADGNVRFDNYSASATKALAFKETGTIDLEIVNPLKITGTLDSGTPQPGQMLEFVFTCANNASTTIKNAVVVDRIPFGTGFSAAQFLDASGNSVPAPVQAPGGKPNPYFDRAERKVYWHLGDVPAFETRKLRLFVRVGYDLVPGDTLLQRAYEFRACSAVNTECDPAKLDSRDLRTVEPTDIRTEVVGPKPALVPTLRLGQAVRASSQAILYQPTLGDVPVVSFAGDGIDYTAVVFDSTHVGAYGTRLLGTLPLGFDVDGDVTMEVLGQTGPQHLDYTLDSDRNFEAKLGSLGLVADFTYVIRIHMKAKADATNARIVQFERMRLENDSVTGTIFGDPSPLNVMQARPFVPFVQVDRLGGVAEYHVGDTVSFLTTYANVGSRPGVTVTLEQDVPAGCTALDVFEVDDAGNVGAQVNVQAKGNKWKLAFARLDAGEKHRLRFRATLATLPKSGAVKSTGKLKGSVATKATGVVVLPPVSDSVAIPVAKDDAPKLFLVRIAPHVVREGLEFEYHLIAGNCGDHEARDVVMTITNPPGTSAFANTATGRTPKKTETFKIGTIPPHSAVAKRFHIIVNDDAGKTGNAVVEESLKLQCSNGTGWQLSKQASLLVTLGFRAESYAWPSVEVSNTAIGVVLGIGRPGGLDDVVNAIKDDSASVMVAGADLQMFVNGAVICPLGGGQVLAFGPKDAISATSGTTTDAFGNTKFCIAAAGDVTVSGIPAVGAMTADAALKEPVDEPQGLVEKKVVNLVAGGGFTIVAPDGRTKIGPSGELLGTIEFKFDPTTASKAGGQIVAAGGGNIVAGGGGNIVAGGGGNIVAAGGGNIVAAGGGNIVAAGGGNMVAGGGGNIVAAGGGNIVAAGGGNIVAAGGGNIVAAGGGNIVAAGGGNIVAAGGGNLVSDLGGKRGTKHGPRLGDD